MDTLLADLKAFIVQTVRDELRTARADDTLPQFMSTSEAAQFARVSQGTIRRWVREGRLVGNGAGREVRVSRGELAVLMHQGRRQPKVFDTVEHRALHRLGLTK